MLWEGDKVMATAINNVYIYTVRPVKKENTIVRLEKDTKLRSLKMLNPNL